MNEETEGRLERPDESHPDGRQTDDDSGTGASESLPREEGVPAPEDSPLAPEPREHDAVADDSSEDDEFSYEIVEPPEDDDVGADGFEHVPAGPTEEVRFDEPRRRQAVRRPSAQRRDRSRRPEAARFARWMVVAAAVAVLILAALALWLLLPGR